MNAQEIVNAVIGCGGTIISNNGKLRVTDPSKCLGADVFSSIRDNKAEIIALLELLAPPNRPRLADASTSRLEVYRYRASAAQKRMLFMEELAGDVSYYNMPVAYHIRGEINVTALESACKLLAAVHDTLRSTCEEDQDDIFIQVQPSADFSLLQVDLRASENVLKRSQALILQEFNHRFDLRREWPFRVLLIREKDKEYKLCINTHHIAADGWSAKNIIGDLSSLYGICSGAEQSQTQWRKPYHYSDFVDWQENWLNSHEYEKARSYWLNQMKDAPHIHSFPVDFNRGSGIDVTGSCYQQKLSTDFINRINLGARAHGVTVSILLQTIFAIFLSRYSGERDIVFGTAAANRNPVEFSETVGLFVNTVPLRFRFEEQTSFQSVLEQAFDLNRSMQRHQSYPFDSLVDELKPVRGANFNPLVQIMLVMQEDAHKTLSLGNTECRVVDNYQLVSKFDLTLHCSINNDAELRWEYRSSLFTSETIERMANCFEVLVASCLSAPSTPFANLPIVPSGPTPSLYSENTTPSIPVHKLFETFATNNPDAPALVTRGKQITYRELNDRANVLALEIAERTQSEQMRVGVLMDRSEHLIVSMLACFKAAAVYVPLDPSYPERRLSYMIEDADLDLILVRDTPNGNIFLDGMSTPVLDVTSTKIVKNADNLSLDLKPETTAYIIYTSGSTGKPKGVMVSHSSIYYSLRENSKLFDLRSSDQMPTVGSQAFGVSLLEMLLPLTNGGSILIVERKQLSGPEELIAVTNGVTVLHAVPSLMRQWLELVDGREQELYPHLRLLLVGGEPVPAELLARLSQWRPDVKVLELYGMTESAVVCASHTHNEQTRSPHCIGKPHPHVNFSVLNSHGAEQPIGVAGELHISGLSLAQGYINKPTATSKAFIENQSGVRLYKTGDRVRKLACGRYEFLGRIDNQVNLRGVRLELGEIEAVANQVDGVEQSVCNLVELNEEQCVALYVVTTAEEPEVRRKVRARLRDHLPVYMHPSFILAIGTMPLNVNGKIDRNQLPRPQNVTDDLLLPQSELENEIAEIWKKNLGVDRIGVDQSFFEIGGHSILASRMATTIRQRYAIEFPLHAVFETPTVRACALIVQQARNRQLKQALTRKQPVQDGNREKISL